jgi:hypothetical protein
VNKIGADKTCRTGDEKLAHNDLLLTLLRLRIVAVFIL